MSAEPVKLSLAEINAVLEMCRKADAEWNSRSDDASFMRAVYSVQRKLLSIIEPGVIDSGRNKEGK